MEENGIALQENQALLYKPPRSALKLDLSNGDVCFSVGASEKRVWGRRKTLTATSPVLGSILIDAWHNGKHNESIKIPDVEPEHFTNFLRYLEEDENFKIGSQYTLEEVIHVFKLAKTFSVSGLLDKCREFLNNVRNATNAITIYQQAQEMNELQLEYDTYAYIVDNFPKVVASPDFQNLNLTNLATFLKLDEVVVKEVDLFRGVYKWAESECGRQEIDITPSTLRLVLGPAIHLVRYPLMSLSELATYVFPKELLTEEEMEVLTKYLQSIETNKRYIAKEIHWRCPLTHNSCINLLEPYRFAGASANDICVNYLSGNVFQVRISIKALTLERIEWKEEGCFHVLLTMLQSQYPLEFFQISPSIRMIVEGLKSRLPLYVDLRPFCWKPRGLEPLKTLTACFYDCLIYNSEIWNGKWKYNLISVNRPIAIVSFGFDGPILENTVFDVKIKLVECADENINDYSNAHCVGYKEEMVLAKKQRVFHVKFDSPVKIKPHVFYKAAYSLRGPKTIWGAEPRKNIRLKCGDGEVVFNFQCVDGQLPEMRFIIPN